MKKRIYNHICSCGCNKRFISSDSRSRYKKGHFMKKHAKKIIKKRTQNFLNKKYLEGF